MVYKFHENEFGKFSGISCNNFKNILYKTEVFDEIPVEDKRACMMILLGLIWWGLVYRSSNIRGELSDKSTNRDLLVCGIITEEYLKFLQRVMVYQFNEDEHSEVAAESKIPGLDSYVGLHYPATDIPQAARVLFQQSRTRMLVDCHDTLVPVIQDESLDKPISLVGSTLRAPHGCHSQFMTNMGSVGSLVMAVIIHVNDKDTGRVKRKEKLWGLVVCHHKSARCITLPLRQACEYIMQAFGLQLNMEMQLLSRLREKHVLRTQALLCGMLLRNSLAVVVTQSPSIMDLVLCDGAALYFRGRSYSLGVTPTEAQIKDIVEWLFVFHGKSARLSTDSLVWPKYPGATFHGNEVCGMAVARITSEDFVFWFRSNSSRENKWGGEKHHPDHKDDEQGMHPRFSFKVFMEVVKNRSLPWDDADIDAIHSLQLILQDLLKNVTDNNSNDIMHAHIEDDELQGKNELIPIATEMVRLIETANAPIFAVNAEVRINGWNTKISELTGLPVDQAIEMSLVYELVYEESKKTAAKLVFQSLRGEEEKNVEIKMRKFDWQTRYKICLGSTKGIAFSHHGFVPHIIHRDIKASNILLDNEFEPRVSDFGLARIISACETNVSTMLPGTLGYIPHEYGQTMIAAFRGDVYSFGVVMMELVWEPENLLEVRQVQEGTTARLEVFMKWKELPDFEATWEDVVTLNHQFPSFHLEDKVSVWGRGIAMNPVLHTHSRQRKKWAIQSSHTGIKENA